jgi:hypothetical protein
MATAVKRKLSSSTDGQPVLIAGTTTASATALHTSIAGTVAGTFDEIWLWAYNGGTASVLTTIEFGGTAVPTHNIVATIPNNIGLIPLVPGLILQNAGSVRAFADTTNVITISGFVNSITD